MCIYLGAVRPHVKLDASASMWFDAAMTEVAQPDHAAPPTAEAHIPALWVRLMRAAAEVQRHAEAALAAAKLPPLAWYDALWEIEKAGAEGIRPFALQPRLLLPQYGLSRLIERLTVAGLVERRACAGDKRGQVLVLTAAGRATRAAMWPPYAGALHAAIGDRLGPGEAVALAELLGRLQPR